MNQRHRFLLHRLGLTLFSFWAVLTILFVLFRIAPGDPASTIVNPYFPDEQRERILAQYALDEPMHIQYISYLQNILTGNLGNSFQTQQPVFPFLIDKTLNSLVLTLPVTIGIFTIGPAIGAFLAWNRNQGIDTLGVAIFVTTFATPAFWVGMLSIMVFSFWLGLLPSGGMRSATFVEESLLDRFLSFDLLIHLILPLCVMFIHRVSRPLLLMRNNMIDVLGEDFIDLKRAEGLSERNILYRHAARNSMLPVVHFAALALGFAFGGSIVLESVFSWPGLGRALWSAVLASDFPVAQGGFLLISAMVLIMNFIVDVVSVFIDPRIADESLEGGNR